MNFGRRLQYYLIGFGMGLVVCFVMFGQRGCDWTPGNRVLKQIATSQILITDSVKCVMQENGISDDDVFQLLNNGDVIFSESKTHQVPKEYIIENAEGKFKIRFLVRNDTVSVIHGVANSKKTTCKGFGSNPEHIFTMPGETVKRILKANEISATDTVFNLLQARGIKDGEIYNMIEGGKIDFIKSMPTLKPHPIYFVTYQNYLFKIEMAEKKTRILEFKVLK
ncbi:MAG TPA: DUF4258 domain-containing protein [Flavobacteriales bacterium]|nr:DUF4258 domain-containing protein [Flavobacteriales bacterium]